MSFQDKAREAIRAEKRDKWLKEVVARNPISLPSPEEVKIEAPPPSENPATTKNESETKDNKSRK